MEGAVCLSVGAVLSGLSTSTTHVHLDLNSQTADAGDAPVCGMRVGCFDRYPSIVFHEPERQRRAWPSSRAHLWWGCEAVSKALPLLVRLRDGIINTRITVRMERTVTSLEGA